MHWPRILNVSTLAAGAAVIALAACGGGRETGPSTSVLPPDSVQQQIAQSVAASVQGQVESLTHLDAAGFLTPFIGLSGDLSRAVTGTPNLLARGLSARRMRLSADFGPNCPTIMPQTPADEDGDGVPDQATFTYSASDCNSTADGESETLSGSVVAGDPTASVPDLDDNEELHAIVLTITGQQASGRLAADGGYALAETAAR